MTAIAAGRIDRATRERDLLARLGLPSTASPEEIETAHDAVLGYLGAAPRDLRSWARQAAADADRAYALLIDPTAPLDPALDGPEAWTGTQPGGPATPPARRAHLPAPTPARTSAPRTNAEAAIDQGADADEVDRLLAEVSPDVHREAVARILARNATRPVKAGRTRRVPRFVLAAAVAVGVVGIAVAGYNLGAPAAPAAAGQATPGPTSGPSLDQARVESLMERLQADPRDGEALMGLADAFFAAGDYATARDWLSKLVALEPDNARALVALGAAVFNLGDAALAETKWKAALEIDPENVEAHYDLGFLYYSATPPDIEGVRREWGAVVDLAPGSDLAETVKAHLGALTEPSASPAAASGSPDGSATPAGSGGPAAPDERP